MQAELEALAKALEQPQRPLAAIVGGAKISTKLDLLGNLLDKVNALIIGGAMANTFLLAQGKNVGKSLAEADLVAYCARKSWTRPRLRKREIVLPVDVVVAEKFEAHTPSARRRCRQGSATHRYDSGHRPAQRRAGHFSPGALRRRWYGMDPSAPSRWNRSTTAPSRVAEAAAELTASRQACLGGGRR